MSNEDKLIVLEDVRDSLIYVLGELNKSKKDFYHYIDEIKQSIDEMTEEIEQLDEEQSHIWQKELDHANKEYESMKI